ncbi:DUF402 domain-containing protein [Krasilnikovia sp. M28-CT-15]|uniref:DUF402 domain-containing protein n=1 Tax=Krasilnikovia sp. M28-CT-15 TaxID=3373540 RepID=UPI0038768685
MTEVEVCFHKYDGRPHRRTVERLLGEDEYGHWLGKPAGGLVHYLNSGDAVPATTPTVRLIPRDQWWTAVFFPEPRPHELYVDVATPAQWTGTAAVTFVDLDLDVLKWRDGRVDLLDEDEFAVHRDRYGYPPEVVAGAVDAAHRLHREITAGTEPFAIHYREWLSRV